MSAQTQPIEGAGDFPRTDADIEDVRMAWRDAAVDARDAYRYWSEAACGHATEAYVVYLAAADRETVAAEVLAGYQANMLEPGLSRTPGSHRGGLRADLVWDFEPSAKSQIGEQPA